MRRALRFAPASFVVALTACATIVHGTQQVIPITSNPPGARVSIDSVPVGITPLSVTLTRGRSHLVSVATDSFPTVDVPLTKQLSGWVFGNAFVYYLPVLLDFGNGAAYDLSPKTVSVLFPGSHWGLARGQRIRLITPESEGGFVMATVDSVAADRLFWRPSTVGAPSDTASASMPVAELRRLHVYQPPDRKTSGGAGMHYATQVTLGAFMGGFLLAGIQEGVFIVGWLATGAAIPVGFFAGAALAPARWSPLEAYRAGSPLLVNDRLRVRLHDSNALIRGRLVDIEANDLLIVARSDTLRVPRSTVLSMQRADGFRIGKGVLNGAAGGALIAFLALAMCDDCKGSQSDIVIAPLLGAYLGLWLGPALAPRRWLDVSKW